ncbi:unnamed protein product [Clonostachys rosea]|uniref:Inhibitor of growth protein N-terminal histone-binding domain-containing protein n=1 Tax=Bionectria ochroleuca TaxID=29856 RepID=A0ABY6TMY4_BIOOC|nr:unnamed protein product [Clonostachys rosea]
MAMDALRNLTTHIPGWLSRLDVLSGEIDKRQTELAALSKNDVNAETRSMRNKGSTESLKPKDDGPSNIPAPEEFSETKQQNERPPIANRNPRGNTEKPRPSSSDPTAGDLKASENTAEAIKAAQERARAQAKKRLKPSSVVSAEGTVKPTYRTRSMIIVYYDSYVQGFFDELVRFTSSSRNLMRKAKMAAKVAQIKKLAEGNLEGEDGEVALPSLRYASSRRFGAMGGISRPGFGPSRANDQPDIYDNLDKGLDFVQGTCEHGAHQFLRDADCNDEIKNIQSRLLKVYEMAKAEMERIEKEEPELAKETGELTKARTHRPISMRKQLASKDGDNAKDDEPLVAEVPPSSDSRGSYIEPALQPQTLEVDTTLEADEGIAVDYELPKLQYRSTRAMRRKV